MPRCKECSYSLVLLVKRGRYKCARCGSLFLQKGVEIEEFLRWNKSQREQDIHNIRQEFKLRRLKNLRRIKKLEPEAKRRITREHNLSYYCGNRAKILQKKKEYRKRTKEQSNVWRRNYRSKFADRARLLGRIHYFRRRQSSLAQKELEINGFPSQLEDSFSDFSISELLYRNIFT